VKEPLDADALRDLAPRVLGAVARRCGDFGAAEDAVQDALLAAAVDWPQRGAPDNPAGWLFHVACRRLADHVDAERARCRREALAAARAAEAEEPDFDFDDFAREDDTLVLLFTCCHPSLTPASAVALVLRAVGGLSTAEIGAAFLVPEATMAQRISRSKQTIRDSGVPFALPEPAERTRRLESVLHVLYLMFNEGYVASSGARLVRTDLSDEAIRLARIVHRLQADDPEATGLLALLLLTDARRAARTGPGGELIPLHEQDRGKWDRALIAEGTALVTEAMRHGAVGSYQLQAAIGSLHDEAATFEATDWPQILALYDLLARMADNPMVELNRAVAFAMVRGPQAGLDRLAQLEGDRRLRGHFRLDAVRAHLFERLGDAGRAIDHYRAAAAHADNETERHYLVGKAAALAGG
jgi:RNA polymerase sigma factor (sigma-70 family)